MNSFVPVVNSMLTITLPGEMLRGVVLKVYTKNTIAVQIASQPLAKSHFYQKDQIIVCERYKTMFGEEWIVKEERLQQTPPIKQEIKDAIVDRQEPKNNKPKHKEVKKGKLPAKTSSSNSIKSKSKKR